MRILKFLYTLLFLFILVEIHAQDGQKIVLEVANQPLNEILLDLREQYGFQLAYDEDLVSGFKTSISKEFNSKEELISYILMNLPLQFEKSGEVFMIFPKTKSYVKADSTERLKIQGQILEASTYEPLPYSNILVNSQAVISDQKGYFSYIASADSTFSVQISHLGYYIYDTVFSNSINSKFFLQPSIKELGEIVVENSFIEKSTHIGDKPGKISMNHTIAPYLPGYGDNTLFNLVRLMPGVLASGEQSADLLIWGSYEGQSITQFDGFTVFGLKNYNDNIGVINPLVIKNIEVYKGGYEAKYGDRVGGFINITGKNGNRKKPSFTASINNSTINSLVEVPVTKKSSLLAAFRKTYYELYDPTEINFLGRRNNESNNNQQNSGNSRNKSFSVDLNAIPDYNFTDANLKYSLLGDNGNLFYISLYGGGDNFNYDVEGDLVNAKLLRNETEENNQKCASALYGKTWKNGNSSNLSIAYSSLKNNSTEKNLVLQLSGKTRVQNDHNIENQITEFYIQSENSVAFPNGNSLEFGAGYIQNESKTLSKLFDKTNLDQELLSQRFYGFVQDNLPIGKGFILKAGLRANYSATLNKFYLDPKLSISLKFEEHWKFNAAWGIYNQFITKVSQVDSIANHDFFWTISDEKQTPVLNANHLVGGLSYHKNDFTVCLEGYFKHTDGLARFYNGNAKVEKGFYSGETRSYGLDIFIKKEYKNNMAWVSYSLSKSEERLAFFRNSLYRSAWHDQRHELKVAGILNVKSFYFSANYVFGSGFERTKNFLDDGETDIPVYSRLDAAIIYKFTPRKVKMEAGLSVLNVLNHENLKFSNLRRVKTSSINSVNVYAEAVPFSPSLFFKIKF